MKIKLNGQSCEVDAGTSIAGLLDRLQLDNRVLAVERNLELVSRTEHAATLLAEGDRLEVVTLVGGG
ncbi:MAG: sulfur carrier protein ThiS [Pirellulales bacterium]|nr:sulfur carrier protein ThiS [Pirellulales bacterium]